jgi:hypothetical protein
MRTASNQCDRDDQQKYVRLGAHFFQANDQGLRSLLPSQNVLLMSLAD